MTLQQVNEALIKAQAKQIKLLKAQVRYLLEHIEIKDKRYKELLNVQTQ